MMINTYGLFWHVDKVFWGQQNNAGALCGAVSRTAGAPPVDFREQRGIYVLYAGYELVYIGQTGVRQSRLMNRLRAHRGDRLSERWDRFSWFGTQRVLDTNQLAADNQAFHPDVEDVLNILESVAIAISEPKLNLQRGRWGEAQQYFQVDLPEAEEE